MYRLVITIINLANYDARIQNLWSLNGQFTQDFAAGAVYGLLYGLNKLQDHEWHPIILYDELDENYLLEPPRYEEEYGNIQDILRPNQPL